MNADEIVRNLRVMTSKHRPACGRVAVGSWVSLAAADLIESLQAQIAQQQSNEPLTLDELREAHKSKPTNADRIRSMSDEELAEWILQLVDCGKENVMCNPTEYKLSGKCNGRCLQGRLDWLIQPAGEGQDNA